MPWIQCYYDHRITQARFCCSCLPGSELFSLGGNMADKNSGNDSTAKPLRKKATRARKEAASSVDLREPASILDKINPQSSDDEITASVEERIIALQKHYGLEKYHVLLLFDDDDDITAWHSNRLYSAASSSADKPILLLVNSLGGQIEPAYLISKTCKRLSDGHFVVAVPRKAKSAATLICLGASAIHMGQMSELGPIDPQLNGLPALGMQNALQVLADLSCKYPGAGDMLSRYLKEKLDLRILGYFDRIAESAVQYAERLLAGKTFADDFDATALADHFVNHYKDHGFVIDADEAEKYLGKGIINVGTPEYQFANAVYELTDFLAFVLRRIFKKQFDFVGGTGDFRLFSLRSDDD